MTSPVSYANAAANGAISTVDIDTKPKQEVEAVTESFANTSVEDSSATTEESTEIKEETDDATKESDSVSSSPSKEKAPKKNLLPAPVPAKSAWGTTSTTTAVTLKEVVDEQRGPISNEQQGQQKFIKPITNRWVPINVKVILPNTRGKSQQQPRRKKSANASQKTNAKKQGKDGKSKEGSNSPATKKEEIASSASSDTDASVEESVSSEAKEESQDEQAQPAQSQQQSTTNSPPFNQNYQKFNQQKPYRRYNNQQQQQQQQQPNGGNYNGQYQKRYSNPDQQQAPQQPQQPVFPNPQSSQQVPGFFHPQPFVPQPPFQNFNNRQFRPQQHQNGQYRGNRNYRGNNYRNGNQQPPVMPYIPYGIAPYPQQPMVQIPPPISPKQEPQQALIQQLDYYFSLENLIRDVYLRKNMDGEGWVSLSLILEFKRVKIIINSIQNEVEGDVDAIILDAVKQCNNLEIKYSGEESSAKLEDVQLRVKENYEQWLLPAEK